MYTAGIKASLSEKKTGFDRACFVGLCKESTNQKKQQGGVSFSLHV